MVVCCYLRMFHFNFPKNICDAMKERPSVDKNILHCAQFKRRQRNSLVVSFCRMEKNVDYLSN